MAILSVGISFPCRAEDDSTDVDASKPGRLLLHVCEIDGTPIRPLVSDTDLRHKFDRQGTPNVSPDGKRVAFDAWTNDGGFSWQESRIVVVDIDGENALDISDGVMPSFSPDGTQLVVSRPPKYAKADNAKGMSIWIMDSDGQNKKMLADRGAWGGRWSADGKSIVFHGGRDDDGSSVPKSCLRLYDIETNRVTNVFSPAESPFASLSFHFAWAKGLDRTVAFGGKLKDGNGSASAIINVDQGISSLKILDPPADGTRVIDGLSFDWYPDGESIIVTGNKHGRPFPVSLSIKEGQTNRSFDGFPDDVTVRDPVYTPDGKNIIASFGANQR
ncbi:PD40 domain-containing protein [Rubripirellula obstinata]|nr:PD40 domain-containing protein [Rubripirellula obstinata]